ncbi:Colicin V production protein [Roseiflexus castenholzii DSM 13941]|uniref:Colicin V production protein n=2 Tax=Roseiflexus castenholzii TaxID=120962 RepID=A7NQC9_ROSCS|nr:Colicin V production protein [Roseiflexus castenholzii DSM 13941]
MASKHCGPHATVLTDCGCHCAGSRSMTMNLLDILIAIVLTLAGIAGYYWGVARQLLALAGLAAGVAVAGRYGTLAADALMSFVEDRAAAEVGGALILLALVSGSASLIASLLHLYVGLIIGGKTDHTLGAFLGVVHAALLISAPALIVHAHPIEPWESALRESALAAFLAQTAGRALAPLLGVGV